MNNFQAFLMRALGIPAGAARIITMAQGWLIYLLLIAVPAGIFFSVVLAAWGMGSINLIISYLLLVAMVIFATWPEILMVVIGLGAVSSPNDVLAGVRTELQRWINFILNMMLVVTVFFYLMGTLPIGRNYTNVLTIIIGAMVFVLLSAKAKIAKALVYTYTFVVVALAFGGIAAPELFYKTFGFDPVPHLTFNAADHTYARIQGKLHEVEVAQENKRLVEIENKLDRGLPLTAEERNYLEQYGDENSLVEKIRDWADEKAKSNPRHEATHTRRLGFGNWPVKLKAGEWSCWYKIPSPVKLEYNFKNTNGKFTRLYDDGEEVFGLHEASFKHDPRFRIHALEDQNLIIEIKPVN